MTTRRDVIALWRRGLAREGRCAISGRGRAPVVFDRSLARRHLRRALAGGYADFLLRRAVDDLGDRLGAVLRRFPLALALGTPTGAAAARLVASERCDRVVRLAPATEAATGLSVVG